MTAPLNPVAARAVAVVLGLAIGLATPLPARAAEQSAPRERWSVPLPDGPRAVVADDRGAVAATNLGDVVALAPNGREVWRTEVITIPARPVLAGDLVLVGDDTSVRAFGRADGRMRWAAPMPEKVVSVAAGAGVVVVNGRGAARAVDLDTGAPLWELPVTGLLHHEPLVDAATASVLVVVPDGEQHRLLVLDARTGVTRWERQVDRLVAVPVVVSGHVYVAEGDGFWHALVLALDVITGERRFASQMLASFESGIVPAADEELVVVVDHYGTVTAVDAATGHVRWLRELEQTVLATRVVLTPRRVVVTTAAKEVVVLDRANGRIVRRVAAEATEAWAIDVDAAPFAGDTAVVAALRLGPRERIALWKSP